MVVGVCFSIGADCDTIETPVNPLDEPALIDEGGLLRGVVVRQAHFHSKQTPCSKGFVYQENDTVAPYTPHTGPCRCKGEACDYGAGGVSVK